MNVAYVYMRFRRNGGEQNAALLHFQSRQGFNFINIKRKDMKLGQ